MSDWPINCLRCGEPFENLKSHSEAYCIARLKRKSDTLLAANDELELLVKGLEGNLKACEEYLDRTEAQRVALEKENTELRKDKERFLDALKSTAKVNLSGTIIYYPNEKVSKAIDSAAKEGK